MRTYLLFLMLPAFLFAQEPTKLRATLSAAGASKAISHQGNNYLIQSSIAQRSTVGSLKQGSLTLRQGFIQPYALSYRPFLTSEDDLGIKLYPNPTRGKVYFSSDKRIAGSLLLEVVDMRAKVLSSFRYEQAPNHIDLSHLAAGLYYLRFSLEEKQQTVPISKL